MTQYYSSTAKWLHWLVALLVIMQFIFVFTADELPRGGTGDMLMQLHLSTGFTILMLAVWRVIHRFMNTPPAPEQGQPKILQKSAWLAHWAMYVLIFALPFTGWMTVATKGGAINWYWLLEIPNFVGKNESLHEQLEEVHEVLGLTLLAIAILHLLAALWHHFIRKDNTLKRMLPGN